MVVLAKEGILPDFVEVKEKHGWSRGMAGEELPCVGYFWEGCMMYTKFMTPCR